jgi:hypothetical protein
MFRFAAASALMILLLDRIVSAAPAPDTEREVKAIIARARAAKGKPAVLQRFKANSYKLGGTCFFEGSAVRISGSGEEQEPDKERVQLKMTADGSEFSYTQVMNNGKGWLSINGVTQDLDRQTLEDNREWRHAGEFENLRGFDTPGVKLSPLGETRIDGKDAVGVRVSSPGFRDVNLYFHKTNGLLLKRSMRGRDPERPKICTLERIFSNYQNIQGVMMPTKTMDFVDGDLRMSVEFSDFALSEKLPDSTFAKP